MSNGEKPTRGGETPNERPSSAPVMQDNAIDDQRKRTKKKIGRAKSMPISESPAFKPNGPFLAELQEFFKGVNELDAIVLNATADMDISQFQLSKNRLKMTLSLLQRLNENPEVTLTVREVEAILRIWLRAPINANPKKRRQNYSPAMDDFITQRAQGILMMLNEGRNISSVLESMKRPVTMDVEETDFDADPDTGEIDSTVYYGPIHGNDSDPALLMTEICRLFYRVGLTQRRNVA